MPTFLERYHAGEREQVWAELIALGEKVREEPVYSDAWAVAQETMRRVKANIETIYERLKAIGYLFEMPNYAYVPPEPDITAQIEVFEREVGPLPLSLRAWLEIVGGVNFMGNYPGLCYYGTSTSPFMENILNTGILDSDLFKGMRENANRLTEDPKIGDFVKQLRDAMTGGRPDVDLFTAFTEKMKEQIAADKERPSSKMKDAIELYADPLCVMVNPDDLSPEHYDEWQAEYEEGETDENDFFALDIAPDIYHKANVSGGTPYMIALPDPGADGYVLEEEHEAMFVDYLRICFQWGGFPGLENETARDEVVLKMLTEGLLEI